MDKTGYVNGSDILLGISGKAHGHSTTHTSTYTTETKDVAVKPPASVAMSSAALFKRKRITGLAMQIKADGLCFYSESESGFKQCLALWKVGQSIPVTLFEREGDATPYASGNFIITSLERTAPAGEDATYSITLDNDGPVAIDKTKLDLIS